MTANKFFSDIHGRFGFGMMRLPMIEDKVDIAQTTEMVDYFLEQGLNYFDTAHGYIQGQSETAIKECLTSRYPRDRYILTNKLSGPFFKTEEDIRPLFEEQLKACGVEYFDFYLMHSQTDQNIDHFLKCRAYETAFALKAEGKIKHVGISFHDRADVLESILKRYPDIEVVQIQFNYVDYDDEGVQSRKCLEVCAKYGKPAIVMEPVKGGNLAVLPEDVEAVFDKYGRTGSNSSYALRFASDFDQIMMVLSGMSDIAQMKENTDLLKDFSGLTETDKKAIAEATAVFKSKRMIPCTGCSYCTDGCPSSILIPSIFADYNNFHQFNEGSAKWAYSLHTLNNGRATDCQQCGKCERNCPQHLAIRTLLKKASEIFDTPVEA